MTKQLENARLALQESLDRQKTPAERNRLGQFATPTKLATDIIQACKALLPTRQRVNFLDPAFGTGSFYSALLANFPESRLELARGFEIDRHYGKHAATLWEGTCLDLRLEDFTKATPPAEADRANLVVCNPPYIRHHYLDCSEKLRLQQLAASRAGMRLSGLAGLYCHFLALTHAWIDDGGIAAWLIPSEFMDVNYGRSVKEYLLTSVTLHRVHRFDPEDLQFADALVSSAVLLFTKLTPPPDHEVEFSYGGLLSHPRVSKRLPAARLRHEAKWTRHPLEDLTEDAVHGPTLAELFWIKRGLASGSNEFFIITPEQSAQRGIPAEFLTPVLPSPRYVPTELVEADERGYPLLDRQLFLFGSNLPEVEIRRAYPRVWTYLSQGRSAKVNETYLCRHRSPWYSQENRPPAPILCTYLSRSANGRHFRFIRNRSNATAANVYLMLYPKPTLARLVAQHPGLMDRIWAALNAIVPHILIRQGRVYGGGLHKLEPKELANTPVASLLSAIPELSEVCAEDQPLFRAPMG